MRVDRQTVVGVRLDAVPRLFSLVKRVYVDDRPAEVSHLVGEGVFDVPGDFVARLLDLFENARLHCVVNFAALQVARSSLPVPGLVSTVVTPSQFTVVSLPPTALKLPASAPTGSKFTASITAESKPEPQSTTSPPRLSAEFM